ncbi:allophanate hydrolase [Winogradskyella sp. PC-19]|uniref:5-oxoprolinase subunit C family protein n=1 Tax=unclassified Winogradskyella TaxID=2615021 RepID=UPI000B3BFADD|nr:MULTISPECIES: biotin-dependent carboxyltransferase family protein [unclassified Winogradskyella]ARV08799.1 allophanate hydrolase [Winogradskyella sp. PC-19]
MIKVLKSGLFSTIQDKGRFGYGEFGVPKSGAMDLFSFELANTLLSNAVNDAVLEITMIGPKLQFMIDTQIVISGANISPHLNDSLIHNNKVYNVKRNDILSFKVLKSGLHAYVAVKDGFKSNVVLNSRSYFSPITSKAKIEDNDVLRIEQSNLINKSPQTFSKLKPIDYSSNFLDVLKGPEFEKLSDKEKSVLLSSEFQVSNLYSRMAYQLSPLFDNDLESILTGPVLPGTVQLTPSGKLIVLMRDCQTTGGYPRVLQLTESAINLLSQKKARDKIVFKLIE